MVSVLEKCLLGKKVALKIYKRRATQKAATSAEISVGHLGPGSLGETASKFHPWKHRVPVFPLDLMSQLLHVFAKDKFGRTDRLD